MDTGTKTAAGMHSPLWRTRLFDAGSFSFTHPGVRGNHYIFVPKIHSHVIITCHGLMIHYVITNLGHHWFTLWLGNWWHQAINWTNGDLSSLGSCAMHLEIWQEINHYNGVKYQTFNITATCPRRSCVNTKLSWPLDTKLWQYDDTNRPSWLRHGFIFGLIRSTARPLNLNLTFKPLWTDICLSNIIQ